MKFLKLILGFLFILGISTIMPGIVSADNTVDLNTYSTNISETFQPSVVQNVYNDKQSVEVNASVASTLYYRGTSIPIQIGDVLVSNSTSSNGLTGHAGIVVNNIGTVVTINGYNNPLTAENMTQWNSKNVRVMRYNNSSVAANAGAWAKNYYHNYASKVSYGLVNTIGSYEKETYCSKIVWDAYFYGANISIDGHTAIWSGVYGPYHLLNESGFRQITSWGQNF